MERAAHGLQPIKVVIICSHVTANHMETPGWLKFLLDQFPKHLVTDFVRHSIAAQRTTTPGMILAEIGHGRPIRKDYQRLLNSTLAKVFDPHLPILTDWLTTEGTTPEDIRQKALAIRRAQGRSTNILPVKTTACTSTPTAPIGSVLADFITTGGFGR